MSRGEAFFFWHPSETKGAWFFGMYRGETRGQDVSYIFQRWLGFRGGRGSRVSESWKEW